MEGPCVEASGSHRRIRPGIQEEEPLNEGRRQPQRDYQGDTRKERSRVSKADSRSVKMTASSDPFLVAMSISSATRATFQLGDLPGTAYVWHRGTKAGRWAADAGGGCCPGRVDYTHFLAADVDGDDEDVSRPQDALPQDSDPRREEAGEARTPVAQAQMLNEIQRRGVGLLNKGDVYAMLAQEVAELNAPLASGEPAGVDGCQTEAHCALLIWARTSTGWDVRELHAVSKGDEGLTTCIGPIRVAQLHHFLDDGGYLSIGTRSFTIIHRAGGQQTHVDALSRNPVCTFITEDKMKIAQQQADLRFVKNPQIKSGIVTIRIQSHSKAVVPDSLRAKCLHHFHDDFGYPGKNKT
ncbi:hypothetical protein LAZ67_8003411 [Cordylochernes scorpioides]|uniref:Uncharacterized protein n=1 Tax=Cordylochernes scorpioides TaxID=51811 RepID=A0ABY6KS78_9ARAC|nr:hypothetical protein LAZ67_8003411 [Cordylochernes scorpioides]